MPLATLERAARRVSAGGRILADGSSMTPVSLRAAPRPELVPLRFRSEIGMVTGIIGAVGGIGGFCLPVLLGVVRQYGGGFGAGFLLLAAAAGGVAAVLQLLTARQAGWRLSWRPGAQVTESA